MATSAQTFRQLWRVGRSVRENAAPHRTGKIRAVIGTGNNAVIIVALAGSPPASFRPSRLTLL